MLDPRTAGSGASTWSYLREIKGEDYLRKLVGQKLALSRDQRVLAEILAKGKIALVLGLTYYSYTPFIKAGLPVAPLPAPKEGVYVSGGSGHLVVFKNAPHPNATRALRQLVYGPGGPGGLLPGRCIKRRDGLDVDGSGCARSASPRQKTR